MAELTEHESWMPATAFRWGTFRVKGCRSLLLNLELTREGPCGAKDSVGGEVGSLPVGVEAQSGEPAPSPVNGQTCVSQSKTSWSSTHRKRSSPSRYSASGESWKMMDSIFSVSSCFVVHVVSAGPWVVQFFHSPFWRCD